MLRASRAPQPSLAGRREAGDGAVGFAHGVVLPDFRGGGLLFVKGLLGWVSRHFIVTCEVLLKLQIDDRTDVE